MTQASVPTAQPDSALDCTNDLVECGWRYQTITLADGTTTDIMVPLTEAEQRSQQAEQRAKQLAALLRNQGINPDRVV